MKKTILVLATTLSAVFALALANADDTASSATSPADQSAGQSAGTIGDTSDPAAAPPAGDLPSDSTCIDRNGATYHRGQESYERCLRDKRQESGTAGSESGLGSTDDPSNTVPGSGSSAGGPGLGTSEHDASGSMSDSAVSPATPSDSHP
jgi:hypothetical protein